MICRPILLHNEFVPAICGQREWEFQVLGHHDGMTVGDIIHMETTDSFDGLFRLNAKYEGQRSDFSTQFYWGFHYDEKREKKFWDYVTPFVFVSFLQFTGGSVATIQKYLESSNYLLNEKKMMQTADRTVDIQTLAYFTMDSSDIMLLIKCNCYEYGAKLINNLHYDKNDQNTFKIRSSYSIVAMDRRYIDDVQRRKLINGNIDLLELRIIERETGSVDGLYESLKYEIAGSAQIERKVLLGTEDEAIIIKNISWQLFLTFYQKETGILCNSNEKAQIYANAISAKLFHSIDDIDKEGNGQEQYGSDNQRLERDNLEHKEEYLWDYLFERVERFFKSECSNNIAEKKNIVMLINAFRKVERAHHNKPAFTDYQFYTMFFPVAAFIVLYQNSHGQSQEYYDFIKKLKLCTQNFTKPNRVFSQMADFNIRYFDIPSKFLALYNAYIYRMRELLNTNTDRQYEFLVCPGMNSQTEVREVYARTKDNMHLFSVEIPEVMMYMMKLMFITLGHEVSHFVGSEIRNRGKRFESVISMSSHMTVIAIREYTRYTNVFEEACFSDEELWLEIEGEMCKYLNKYMYHYKDREYFEKVYFHEEAKNEYSLQFTA